MTFEEADCSSSIFHYSWTHIKPLTVFVIVLMFNHQRSPIQRDPEDFIFKSHWNLTEVNGDMRSTLSALNQPPSSLKIWSKHNIEHLCVDWKLTRKEMMGMIKEAQWQSWSRTRKQRSVTRLQTWVSANPPLHWTGTSLDSFYFCGLGYISTPCSKM